ncbi:MAG: hypothetical protein PHO56_00840 [Patescibacteria group bacterium]|nr:hypothetical protein [Patescibacteria group bacterium]
MVIIKIPRNYQIIIYSAILALVVIFFFYFFRQASITPFDLSEMNVITGQSKSVFLNNGAINMNLDLFSNDKFLNLRSEVAPTQSFQSGKRNPFEPQ